MPFNYVKIVLCLQIIKKKSVYKSTKVIQILRKLIMLLFRFPVHGEIDALKVFHRDV